MSFNIRWSGGHKTRCQGQGHKKIRGQGQGQTLSRPRTGMLEAKARTKDTSASVLQKKVFKNFFQAFSSKKCLLEFFFKQFTKFQQFKKSVVLKPRTGQFLRT